MCGSTPARNSGNEEGPDSLCGEHLSGADAVAHGENPVPNIRLFLRAVVLSERQIPQVHFPWENSVKTSVTYEYNETHCNVCCNACE